MKMKIEKISVVDQTIDWLKEYIEENQLKEGDRMPTEQEVCNMCGIGRSTVREAYRMMQALKITESVRGKGVFFRKQEKPQVERSEIADWFRENSENIENYMEVRNAVELMAVRMAMKKGDKKWIEHLNVISEKTKEILAGGHTRQNRGVLMTLYDEEFHQKITSVSKNPLLICIEKTITDCLADYRNKVFMLDENIERAYRSHCAIIEAIQSGDVSAAEETINEHLADSLADMKMVQEKN